MRIWNNSTLYCIHLNIFMINFYHFRFTSSNLWQVSGITPKYSLQVFIVLTETCEIIGGPFFLPTISSTFPFHWSVLTTKILCFLYSPEAVPNNFGFDPIQVQQWDVLVLPLVYLFEIKLYTSFHSTNYPMTQQILVKVLIFSGSILHLFMLSFLSQIDFVVSMRKQLLPVWLSAVE